ncbi:DNA-binding SARP family transcriptional activator [Herbihabitans rhizosphaerae]|uniref:DNA-binding SARP family transcriptional activator n=1 Tax=Herbihabitans rhizosphaerae TaxID=1872711 RepID=A0A4V2EUM2_9PSEU|nr:BTAD domain-containing putative transcriptional regulator [Herbihabitans rhizosphaerae]RZS45063.1 DNA-binding SARP family transcriptional activator [Herbihabitans rhizosphaerae]
MEREGRPVDVPSGRQRSLLAILALSPNLTATTDTVIRRLWGADAPPGAPTTVRGYVKRLRRLLDVDHAPSVIRTVARGYQLDLAPDDVDVVRFTELVRDAQTSDRPGGESELLRQALSLWRGPALSDVDCDALHREALPALREQYLRSYGRFLELELPRRPEDVITELRGLVTEYPLREGLWTQLISALHRCGRQAEALATYADCREVLADELGAEPGATLRALHQRVLNGDTATDLIVPAPRQPDYRTPHQLPPVPQSFAGRAAEAGVLDRMLDHGRGDTPIAVVDGPAGVGKTALAVHWAHRNRHRFPGGEIYIDLQGYSGGQPLAPTVALRRLLNGLGETTPPTADLATLAAAFRSVTTHRGALIILDNAKTSDQVRQLLPGAGNAVLTTSRSQLRGLVARDGASRLRLGQLDRADSAELLTRIVGEHRCGTEKNAVDELVEHCGGLPLALRLLGEYLTRHPDLPLQRIAALLGNPVNRAGVLRSHEESTDLATVFSWSIQALPGEARRLLRLLAASDVSEIESEAAMHLAGMRHDDVLRWLDTLVEANIVQQPAPDVYTLDALTRTLTRMR